MSGIALRLTTIGNASGLIRLKQIIKRLHVVEGDDLYVVETANGIELIPHNPTFAAQIEVAEQVMQEDQDVLKKLAE